MRSVLVVTPDHVAGALSVPGIRALNFARELTGEFAVTLAARSASLVEAERIHTIELTDPEDEHELGRLVDGFDAVVAQRLPFATMRRLAREKTQVIYDLYVPFAVEHLTMAHVRRPRAERLLSEWSVAAQRFALATGNSFVCVTERQRDFWLGMLARLGRIRLDGWRRDPTLRDLIDVVPFGIPRERPAAAEGLVLKGVLPGVEVDDRVLLWAGGLWDWLDPLTPIRAVELLERDDVKLVFLGTRHPRVPETAAARRARDEAEARGLLDRRVFFRDGWVDYSERGAFLLEADVGASAHLETLESRYAFRTRLLDHVWAGLPTIATAGDELGERIERAGAGRTAAAEDAEAFASAMAELLERPPPAKRYEELRSELAWARVVEPLRRLVRLSGDAIRPPLGLEDRTLRLRASLALGGPAAAVGRQLRKVTR